jgi:hypothetical protein
MYNTTGQILRQIESRHITAFLQTNVRFWTTDSVMEAWVDGSSFRTTVASQLDRGAQLEN